MTSKKMRAMTLELPAKTHERGAAHDERTAVDKAFSILMAFGGDARGVVGVSELARRTGLSKSTAFRLLSMLERNRVVERVGTSYRVGTLMDHIGSPAHTSVHNAIRDSLTPFLAELYERTHHTVHLAVLHGTDVVYLNKLYGHRPARSPSRIGGRAPAYATAVGKVLLAWSPESTDQTLDAPLVAWTENTITDGEILLDVLAAVRKTGVAFDRGESLVGLSCIAAPIMGRTGRPIAAFSISGPTGSIIPEDYAHVLRTVCYAASQSVRTSGAAPTPHAGA
jgi:IclR family KDG regulon transcriptional repressor